MKFLISIILITFMSISYASSDYNEYKAELNEYKLCVQTANVFSGGPECVEPVYTNCTEFAEVLGYCPVYDVDSPIVYDNGILHIENVIVIQDHKVIELSYVKMELVDGVFVITEIIE